MEIYTEFINKFKEISHPYVNCVILNKLKEEYKDIINSKRVLDQIIDISSLLKILEKRGILQYDKINILKYITQHFVDKKNIEKLITDYEQWLEQNTSKINNFYNYAIQPSSYSNNETSGRQYCKSTSSHINNENIIQELIINKVSKKIGKYWADVCRRLNFEESIIEEIEMKYFNETKSFGKMFEQALRLYFSEYPKTWKTDLLQALQLSRRKDLKEIIEEILVEYNL